MNEIDGNTILVLLADRPTTNITKLLAFFFVSLRWMIIQLLSTLTKYSYFSIWTKKTCQTGWPSDRQDQRSYTHLTERNEKYLLFNACLLHELKLTTNIRWPTQKLRFNQACSKWGVGCAATRRPLLCAAWTTIANRAAARAVASCCEIHSFQLNTEIMKSFL